MQKVFKVPKIVVPFILLCLFLVYGCDSGGGGEHVCSFYEMQERFANTNCITEEFITGCSNLGCSNRGDAGIGVKEISAFRFSERCTFLDCETLECELRVSGESLFGLVSELSIDEMTMTPIGIFVLDEQESPFTCTVFVQ